MNSGRIISEGVFVEAGDGLDTDTANEFASFIDDMNSTDNADAWITVMRIPTDSRGAPMPNSKHLGQLFNEPLGSSSVNDVLERIRRDFIREGENSITVRIIGKQAGKQGLKFNRIYTIERSNKSEKAGGPTDSIASLGRMMVEMQRASDERMERIIQMQNTSIRPAGENLVDSLVKLAPILTPFITGMLGRPPGAVVDPAAQMLATLKAFKEANNIFGGGNSDDGESTMKTVRAVAEVIGPGLKFLANREERLTAAERMQRARLPAPQPAAVAPKPIPPKPIPPKPMKVAPSKTSAVPAANNKEDEDMNLKETRERIEMLAQLCDEGRTPAEVAELVVDSIDDEQLEELYTRVSPENFVASIKILCPAVKGREEFFEKLRVEILNQYETDPDAVDPAPGPVNGSPGANDDAADDPTDLADSPVDLDGIPDAGGSQ
jgi:hypothetical protein